jgi:hypothetical protein
MRRLIEQADYMIDPPPQSILYAYGEYNSMVPELQKLGVNVFAGVPPEELIKKQPKPALIILDGLLYTISESYLNELFTKKVHHHSLGLFFLSQNTFEKKCKVPRQNSMYIILTRAPASQLAIKNLGIQLFPRQLDFFLDAYKQATRDLYSYLFIDLHPSSDPTLRLRTNIFRDQDQPQTIFLPKNA